MEQKNLSISDNEIVNDVLQYVLLNDIKDIDSFTLTCFKNGYFIQKYGLLNEEASINIKSEDNKELQNKINMLTETIQHLKREVLNKDNVIKEQQNKIDNLSQIISNKLLKFT